MIRSILVLALVGAAPPVSGQSPADAPSRAETLAAMRKAAEYYTRVVAVHGGYVYYYSPTLSRRLGEGKATPSQVWVQPPGTPTVGLALLAAYRASGETLFLDGARDAARALVHGQLRSGGWTNKIDFDPNGEPAAYLRGHGKGKDNSTLDDDISQAALRCLMRVDQALDFRDEPIHEAARIGLDALLAAQFANGGFPQVWTGPRAADAAGPTDQRAQFPDYDWRTENRVKEYWTLYTLNDDLVSHVADTLFTALEVYDDPRCRSALERLGGFLVLAQLPDPQPAWAQQYDLKMRPVWARKFEPPAVSGRESQDAIATLLRIHGLTRDDKLLAPIPAALAYLRRSLLPDGRLARYYELRTNRPLYMTRDYQLTHDDSNLPDHYGWKNESRLDDLEAALRAAQQGHSTAPPRQAGADRAELARRAAEIRRTLDAEGRWISTYDGEMLVGQPKFARGEQYLSSAVFSENLETLAAYLAGQ